MVELKRNCTSLEGSENGINLFSATSFIKLKQSNEKKIRKIYMVMYFVDFHRS